MAAMAGEIRNAVRAIIIKDKRILLCEYHDDEGYFYVTPGGGQEYGEDMKTALRRECLEELGVEVNIGDIAFVRDAMFKSKNNFGIIENHQQIEYFFSCELPGGADIKHGKTLDPGQTGIKWIPVEALGLIRIYPSVFADLIHADGTLDRTRVYLGVVN